MTIACWPDMPAATCEHGADKNQRLWRSGGFRMAVGRKKRLSAERAYVAELSSKRAEAGSLGVLARAASKSLKDKKSAQANGSANGKQNASTHTHTHTHTQSLKDKSFKAADAAPASLEKQVFDLGKPLLGSGGQVKKLIRHHDGDLAATKHTLELAATKADPKEYVGAILRGDRPVETDWHAEYRRMGMPL